MTITHTFIQELQDLTAKPPFSDKFWEDFSSSDGTPTFQNFLDKYAQYNTKSLSLEQKAAISNVFWELVQDCGTPIIEEGLEGSAKVYFLFPREDLLDRQEPADESGSKKHLYLQGDFHGYGSTDGRQLLSEIEGTGIMCRADIIPIDAIVVYKFIQVEPSFCGKKPEPELPRFFNEDLVPISSNKVSFPEIQQVPYKDKYSRHLSPYPGFEDIECVFRVNIEPTKAQIPGEQVDWPSLLSNDDHKRKKHFTYNTTLYSDKDGDLHHISEAEITDKYNDELYFANGYNIELRDIDTFEDLDISKLKENPCLIKDKSTGKYKIWGCLEKTWQLTDIDSSAISYIWEHNATVFITVTDPIFDILKEGHTPYLPYANFTRDIQVFTPSSGQTDNLILINDGIPYLLTGIIENFEKLVEKGDLSPNTALVFVHILPGLIQTLSEDDKTDFAEDPSFDVEGMGVRMIDYKYKVDQYANFIEQKLFPQLVENDVCVPEGSQNRVMLGSSLSGTASIYIGLQYPNLFGEIISQSPSPDNRSILSTIPVHKRTGRNIHLSCGVFEHPNYAASNDNFEYAEELSDRFNIRLAPGLHGHQFIAWNESLDKSLPNTLAKSREVCHQYRNAVDTIRSYDSFKEDVEKNSDVGNKL
ncbi:MAG: alpha/beta hydrolase-fold protein [Legionellaceae bacterium]|nr:alpha/beta hydrolase-fold protein [Legionellaceae bacterium]